MSRLPPPGPLYAIADLRALGEEKLPSAVAEMAEAGVKWIQVRAKPATGRSLFQLLERTVLELEGTEVAALAG